MRVGPPRPIASAAPPRGREIGIAAIASLLLSLFVSRGILFQAGWVGMRHDWAPVAFPGQIDNWAIGEFYGWNQVGIGVPSSYPNDWLILEIVAKLAHLVPAMAITKCVLFGVLAVAGFAVYLLARHALRLGTLPSAAAAFLMLANPVIFNKMIAGQLAYLSAYALLPLWMYLYVVDFDRPRLNLAARLAAGVVAAVISSQIQYIVFILLIAAIDLVASGRQRLLGRIVAAVCTAATIIAAPSSTLSGSA